MPAAKVAQMTRDELKEMIDTTVEQKLLELLGEPDEGCLSRNRFARDWCDNKRWFRRASVAGRLKR